MGSIIGEKLVARMLNRRGNRINLPQPLEPGELGWCYDTKQLFIGLNDEYSIAAVEVYEGATTIAQAQTIVNDNIIEFSTFYARLNTPTNEEQTLEDLGRVPASAFILDNHRQTINNYEQNIELLNTIRILLGSYIQGNHPYTYVYDWVTAQPTTATATATLSLGTVASITVVNAGLGYTSAPAVSISGDGIGATASASVSTDGNGTITTITVTNPGSGYTTATVSLVAPTVVPNKSTTLYKFTFYVGLQNVSVDTYTDAEMTTTLDSLNGTSFVYDTFEITDNSAGVLGQSTYYSSTVSFDGNTDVNLATNEITITTHGLLLGDRVVVDDNGNTTPTGINDGGEYYVIKINNNTIKLATSYSNAKLGNAIDLTIAGAGTIDLQRLGHNPKNKTFVDGLMYLSTVRNASNVSGLINKIADSTVFPNGLTNTKQNVEILTELSGTMLEDILFTNPLSYKLDATAVHPLVSATYTAIDNTGGTPSNTYTSAPLEYSATVSDVQIIEYSLITDDNNLLRVGTLKLSTLNETNEGVAIDDDYVENRGAGITAVSLGGPDFDFGAEYNNGTGKVIVKYRHNFSTDVILRVTTRRWNSF